MRPIILNLFPAASLVAHGRSGEKEEAVGGTGYGGEIRMMSVAPASENGRKHQCLMFYGELMESFRCPW